MWKDFDIIVREDKSFVITKDGNPYHVPTECDAEWTEVYNYVKDHPGQVKPEVVPEPEPLTPEQTLAQFTAAIQSYLDAFARTRNYDGILSAATYATSTNAKFQSEGQYAVTARDAVWAKAYEILAQVESGQRPLPSMEVVLSELPVLAWPEV